MREGVRPLIAGNWKMFHGGASGIELAANVVKIAPRVPHVDLVIAPPFTALAAVAHECETGASPGGHAAHVAVAAQNLHHKPQGAFTGEVSGPMLRESGCTWVIVGHSERRQYCGETDAAVVDKVAAAFEAGLLPIVCVGETLAEREAGQTLSVVARQVKAALDVLGASGRPAAAIAYEPVWAIGTGKNATARDAEEVHAAVRGWLGERSGALARATRVLYGGSLKPDNARDLLACPNVDGGLIGGASLDAGSFGAIAEAAEALAKAAAS